MTEPDHDGDQNPRTQTEQERLAKLRLLGLQVRLLNRFDGRYEALKNESVAKEQHYLHELESAQQKEQHYLRELEGAHQALSAQLEDARQSAARERELQSQLENARLQLQEIWSSRSWRYTQPLRDIGKWIGTGQDSAGAAPPQNDVSLAAVPQVDNTPAVKSSTSPTELPVASGTASEADEPAALVQSPNGGLETQQSPPASADSFVTGGRDAWDETGARRLQEFLSSDRRLSFPNPAEPAVSIIVVLYNKAHLGFLCLESLLQNAGEDYELVLVDNGSSDATGKLLERIDGAKVVRNSDNTGFGHACGQGAATAAGEYLCFLNNDTVLCPGALSAVVADFREDASLGAVGGKLLLSDGRLQEAGSIVWRDATAWGYGRGDDAGSPKYAFRRPVDYCSGALLFTPRALFAELGGFDERFLPAYYEDTDYCFKVWEKGRKVIYEPRAAVHHYESASMQNSEAAAALIANHQAKFVEKWKSKLQAQLPLAGLSIPYARIAAQAVGARMIYMCARVPHRGAGPDSDSANDFLTHLAAEGHHVTCVSMTEPLQGGEYSDLPREIEFTDASSDVHYVFRELLLQYDAAWIVGSASMREFLAHMWDLTGRVPTLIYQIESIPNEPDNTAADRLEMELAFCHAADIVLVKSEEERQRLRPHLEGRIELLSEQTTRQVLSDILDKSKQRRYSQG